MPISPTTVSTPPARTKFRTLAVYFPNAGS